MEQGGVILAVAVALGALAAWVVAAISALEIVRLAPKGGKLAAYWNLGWWRHAAIAQALGPAANAPLRRYRFAFCVFFGCVLAMIAAVFLLTA